MNLKEKVIIFQNTVFHTSYKWIHVIIFMLIISNTHRSLLVTLYDETTVALNAI